MAETARDVIARIRRKRREQDYCFAVLDLWAQVQGQGIEVNRVASFGFDSHILTEKQDWDFRRNYGKYIETLPTGEKRPRVYNYVRHHDGGMTRLDPMLQAVYEPETEEKLLGKTG
jgi:hypothetical protein